MRTLAFLGEAATSLSTSVNATSYAALNMSPAGIAPTTGPTSGTSPHGTGRSHCREDSEDVRAIAVPEFAEQGIA